MSKRRTIWIVDAYGYGKRFVVRAYEKLTAFLELTGDTRVRGEFGPVMAAHKRARRVKVDRIYGTRIGDSLPEIRRNYQLSSAHPPPHYTKV
jgi:hypothetical protein